MKIIIIDYKAGNILSVQNMLKKSGFKSIISSDPEVILNADKLILPGVGHFSYGMQQLQALNLINPLKKKVLEDKTPLLGICLGAQLMTQQSEESDLPGFGFFNASTIKFDNIKYPIKVPNMGWNDISLSQRNNPLFRNLEDESRFYFVHSYHFISNDPDEVVALAHHGYDFPCVLNKNHIFGVQFHPEKSHKFGMNMLKNFVELT